jgi:hypothetical protein
LIRAIDCILFLLFMVSFCSNGPVNKLLLTFLHLQGRLFIIKNRLMQIFGEWNDVASLWFTYLHALPLDPRRFVPVCCVPWYCKNIFWGSSFQYFFRDEKLRGQKDRDEMSKYLLEWWQYRGLFFFVRAFSTFVKRSAFSIIINTN